MARRRRRAKSPPKKDALRVHSFRRAVERYPELDVTDELRAEIVGQIRSNKSTTVEKQSGRVTIHDVTLSSGHVVRVAYDKRRGCIITFLHRDESNYQVLRGENHARAADGNV